MISHAFCRTAVLSLIAVAVSGAAALDLHVDDNAVNDPGPGDVAVSDPLEDGSADHPFDAIQEAIDAALPGDTVMIADGTYTGVGNRDLDTLGKAITVKGASGDRDACVIDAESLGRGFYIHSNEDPNTVIAALTITGGYADATAAHSENGGGILCVGAAPTLIDCHIVANETTMSGGGIRIEDGSAPTLLDCLITENTAATSAGGVYVHTSGLTAVRCAISHNQSQGGGGMRLAYSADVLLESCLIARNVVTNFGDGDGGGILCYPAGTATFANCTIADNSCDDYGGGIASAGELVVENSIIWGNDAAVGDQIRLGPVATVMLSYSNVAQDAGDISLESGAAVNWAIGNINADPLLDAQGMPMPGSPCIDAGDPNVIDEGQLDLAGGPRVLDGDGDGTPIIDIGAFEVRIPAMLWVDDNAANDPGPGDVAVSDPLEDGSVDHPFDAIQEAIDAALPGDTVLIADGTYTGVGNRDLDTLGKAITVKGANGDPTQCVIDCEQAGRGFYVHSEEDPNTIIENVRITNGRADDSSAYGPDGGGLLCVGSSPTLVNCIIEHGFATRRCGGVQLHEGSAPTLIGCKVVNNTSIKTGAGIYVNASSLTAQACTISGNVSELDGGGVRLANATDTLLQDCVISGNQAFDDGGGILCYPRGDVSIVNCTVINNVAGGYGGGINIEDSNVDMVSTIVWGNTAGSGDEVQLFWANASMRTDYCDIQQGAGDINNSGGSLTWGVGNINADPLLDAQGMPMPGSPCIDAGDPNVIDEGQLDLAGGPRVLDGDADGTAVVDMGAFEYNQPALGDMNCDGTVDTYDIDAFVLALCSGQEYTETFPACNIWLADCNEDGFIDSYDIDAFVTRITENGPDF